MPVQISEYDAGVYASLPLALGDVEREINAKGGRDIIHKELGLIFRNSKVDERYVHWIVFRLVTNYILDLGLGFSIVTLT